MRRDLSVLEQPAPGFVAAGDPDQARGAAERRDVARGVAGAARHDLGRVVVQDQDRRLARHARDLAVDELVGDQIAGDHDAAPGQRVDEREQPSSLARAVHCLFQNPRGGVHQVVHDRVGHGAGLGRGLVPPAQPRAHQHAARADGLARGQVVPAVPDDERVREIEIEVRGGPQQQPGLRLAAVAGRRYCSTTPVGIVRAVVEAVDSSRRPPRAARRCAGAPRRRTIP